MMRVDLLLGSDIGIWTLDRVSREDIHRVFTLDSGIARAATRRGLDVSLENVNKIPLETSEVGFSVHYPRILHPSLLERYRRVFNLHPGYLPWGRGYYPVFWAIWEQSPAGATLHEISVGIDEGPIVAQQKVEQFASDTGGSLFERVREAEKKLFMEFWPRIVAGEELPAQPQSGVGSYHSRKDFFDMKRECEWWKLGSECLIRLIRALSFPNLTGLEIGLGGTRFELHLTELLEERLSTEGRAS